VRVKVKMARPELPVAAAKMHWLGFVVRLVLPAEEFGLLVPAKGENLLWPIVRPEGWAVVRKRSVPVNWPVVPAAKKDRNLVLPEARDLNSQKQSPSAAGERKVLRPVRSVEKMKLVFVEEGGWDVGVAERDRMGPIRFVEKEPVAEEKSSLG
jgi:hypothetical protein